MTVPATETTETPTEPEEGTTTVVVETTPAAEPEPEAAPEGDTTVVVVGDTGGAEEAQEAATNLDHEHRITNLEHQLREVESSLFNHPTHEDVRAMIPDPVAVVEAAAVVAEAVATEVVDQAEGIDEQTGTVRVEEAPDGSVESIVVEPNAPAATDAEPKKKRGMFTW